MDCQIAEVGTRVRDILFANLAGGVRNMPRGHDALDLTRMVQYCVERSSEGWMYPSQYEELLKRIGRPHHPNAANIDLAAFGRWRDIFVPRIRSHDS